MSNHKKFNESNQAFQVKLEIESSHLKRSQAWDWVISFEWSQASDWVILFERSQAWDNAIGGRILKSPVLF